MALTCGKMMCPLSKETIIFRDKGCQLILSFVANWTKQAIWFYIPNSMYQGILQALDAVAKLQKWKILAFGGSWLGQEIHYMFHFFFSFLSSIVITRKWDLNPRCFYWKYEQISTSWFTRLLTICIFYVKVEK